MKTLSLKEAAALLRMHPQTVRRLALKGELPAAKPGKSWLFVEDDLLAWVRSRYVSARQVPAGQEVMTQWHSTKEATRSSGGSASPSKDGRYADLLGLRTRS
jgi:excisionase family DNA binding protein